MARVVAPFTPLSTKSASAALAIATCLAGFGPRRPMTASSSKCDRALRAIRARVRPAGKGVFQHFDRVIDRHGGREHGAHRAVLLARQLDCLGDGAGVEVAA